MANGKGRWIPVSCWSDCGSKGFNKVYVVDGVIVRAGTDETIPDTAENPQLRGCAKGRALRMDIMSPDRLKYPMVRKNWAPGGGKKELRGRDEWVRISWNEALDILASELKRIVATHGNEAIYSCALGSATASSGGTSFYSDMGRLLSLSGGFVADWASCSSGSWTATGPAIGLPMSRLGTGEDVNDFMDLQNSQLVVFWAYNPAWSRSGIPMRKLLEVKKAGAKFVSVDPFFNPSAVAMEVAHEDWYPVRPATDHAMVLGMMHTLLTEDHPTRNPLVRWDYINKYTVGFDKDHMPAGADPKENLKDYILGTYDKQPKTAACAAAICGVAPENIKKLAREIAKTERVALIMSPAPARVNNADSWPQLIMTFGAMTGHIGTTGNVVGSDGGHSWLTEGPQLVRGGTWLARPSNFSKAEKIENPINPRVNRTQLWDAILNGKYRLATGKDKDCNFQMIYFAKAERMGQLPGAAKAIEAVRKVEFVACNESYLTTCAKFADLLLPVTSMWERPGNLCIGYKDQITLSSKAIEPLFEAKDDIWIAKEAGKRMGFDPDRIQPYSLEQDLFYQVLDATVWDEAKNDYVPLVTVTDADLKRLGFEGTAQQGVIGYQDFVEKGIYHFTRKKGDKHNHIVMEDFIKDPVANPLPSRSGKLEVHCKALVEAIDLIGFSKVDPIPTYRPPIEGYEGTFKDWGRKTKGDYSMQLLNLHVPMRAHSTFGGSYWLRELFDHTALINPIDAKAKGLQDNETVLIKSRHGKILIRVQITPNVRPGVVGIGQGAWILWDDKEQVDRGGNINILIGAYSTGQGHQGWNSCNIEVEKWNGEPLPEYVKMPVGTYTASEGGRR
jgi:anaerobic dimethyl sulfoxide reductase subunit A